ncbi:peptide chain release factor N(5)-glutamine methyltransferase [Psychromonas sp. psych-6C06]|uniref:peptide chain release factor N(5)-glutamine methyltransferase n=1 Tax=Psychromonas sp. psych-6C06 TaxID=2058089 RepID=UPI000C33BE1A|nr:peptide chain release factor N(5)-glutamine methyltransferase [Psychromonas sp. psych-6C06]PKF60356.1 peptide chain release factor N(5)-glutamine methyltransferase [Psychromonas sp. psych-6C06]
MRIDDALVWAQFLLSGSGSPRLDAEVLLAHVLEKETIYLMTWPERDISATDKASFEALVEQRINGVPVAHLTGTREFWSLPLKVNNSTLIPRPDTEILVETALNLCASNAAILDLGTGSGAIILALASELPQATCTAVDFSEDAVSLARENATLLKINNVSIAQSNWFDNVQGTFDVIVSNPPYIADNDHHLKKGDVRFEPLSALVSAENGLADIRLIAEQAIRYLNDNGYLLIEHGFEQGSAVRDIFTSLDYHNINTIKDYGDNDRVTVATYKSIK